MSVSLYAIAGLGALLLAAIGWGAWERGDKLAAEKDVVAITAEREKLQHANENLAKSLDELGAAKDRAEAATAAAIAVDAKIQAQFSPLKKVIADAVAKHAGAACPPLDDLLDGLQRGDAGGGGHAAAGGGAAPGVPAALPLPPDGPRPPLPRRAQGSLPGAGLRRRRHRVGRGVRGEGRRYAGVGGGGEGGSGGRRSAGRVSTVKAVQVAPAVGEQQAL